MELMFAAVFLFAAWHTVKHGVPAAGRAIARGYRGRMGKWSDANPDASWVGQVTAGMASGVATIRYGPGWAWREFRQSARDGWAAGKDRYLGTAPVPEPEHEPPARPGPPRPRRRVGDRYTDPASGQVYEWDGARRLHAVPNTPPTNEEKEPEMAIETATGGEVTNPETLHAELTAVVKEASTDYEDAQGDSARAKQDLARIDTMAGSVTRLKLPTGDIAMVTALREPAQRRLAAAESRAAAASERLSQAQAALSMAAKHVQLVGQAAGEFYN